MAVEPPDKYPRIESGDTRRSTIKVSETYQPLAEKEMTSPPNISIAHGRNPKAQIQTTRLRFKPLVSEGLIWRGARGHCHSGRWSDGSYYHPSSDRPMLYRPRVRRGVQADLRRADSGDHEISASARDTRRMAWQLAYSTTFHVQCTTIDPLF